MFIYEKKLQFPVKIATPNPKLAAFIISQYGGPYINRLQAPRRESFPPGRFIYASGSFRPSSAFSRSPFTLAPTLLEYGLFFACHPLFVSCHRVAF